MLILGFWMLVAAFVFSWWNIIYLVFFSRALPLPAKQVREAEALFRSRAVNGEERAKKDLALFFDNIGSQIRKLICHYLVASLDAVLLIKLLAYSGHGIWPAVVESKTAITGIVIVLSGMPVMIFLMHREANRLRNDIFDRFEKN